MFIQHTHLSLSFSLKSLNKGYGAGVEPRFLLWTRVQDPTCPVKKFTGHKPGPLL